MIKTKSRVVCWPPYTQWQLRKEKLEAIIEWRARAARVVVECCDRRVPATRRVRPPEFMRAAALFSVVASIAELKFS